MGKLVDEAKKKEAAEGRKILQKVEIEYLKGKYGPVLDAEGKVVRDGQRDLVFKPRAERLKKIGVAKLVMLITLLSLGLAVNAQNFTIYSNTVTAPVLIISDTIDDTEANDTTILFKLPHNEPWAYSVHLIAATISGTTDIDVDYQWSNDGTNWLTFQSDSIAASNLQFILEDLTGFGARYMRILRTGVGTHSSKMLGYLYVFKVPGAK